MLKVALKGLFAHKLRLALTTLAIVLGVSFVTGTLVLSDTMRSVFDDLLGDATAGVDLHVRAVSPFQPQFGSGNDEREPLQESLVATVAAVEGVDVAVGAVDGYARFVGPDGEPIGTQAPTLGASWVAPPLGPFVVRDGIAPSTENEVAVDAATARQNDLSVGDEVDILFVGPTETFTIVGIVGFGEADNLAGATFALFELETAQRVLGFDGTVKTIYVTAAEGVEVADLRGRIDAALPDGVEAVSAGDVASEQSEQIKTGLGFITTALLVFAGIALFVGAFIIANTFAIIVAQRTREFALLRALGASTGQVTRAVLVEALVVALFASAVGIAVGVGLAVGLKGLLGTFGLSLPGGGLILTTETIVVGAIVGVVVTLLSALVPARRAAKVAPVAAMRLDAAPPRGTSRTCTAAGVVVGLLGITALAAGLLAWVPQPVSFVGLGAVLVFGGVGLLSPVLVRPLAKVIGWPARRAGVSGRLAAEQAARNPRRTASTASALMIGLALVSFIAILGTSIKASASAAIDEAVRADFILQGSEGQFGMGFSPAVGDALDERSEFAVVSPVRFGQARTDRGSTEFIVAFDPATIQDVAVLDISSGSLADLDRDAVAMNSTTASDLGLAVGDTVGLEFSRTGRRDLVLAATFEPSQVIGGNYALSLDAYRDNFTNRLDVVLFVEAAEDVAAPTARAAIEEVAAAFPGVEIFDQTEYKAEQASVIDQLLGLVTVLLLLAIIIALLGITNTLALAVSERTREIGLLRAVGMMRRQVRATIRWESLIVALIGAVLGLAVGTFFGWAFITALRDEGFDRFAIPVGQLATYAAVAGVAGVFAGSFPARRAARIDVLRAIAHG